VLKRVRTYLNSGHERSIVAKKNILAMVLIKGLNILISLLLVPLTIHYVNTATYGIWLTLSSIVAWISFFDIGLNNGLRNRFAEAKANNDIPLAQRLVSTTYAILVLIFIPLLIIFLIANQWINWGRILNAPIEMQPQLPMIASIVVGYFCIKFILSTINIILIADQNPAGAAARGLVEQIVTLLIIFILTKFTHGSLINLTLALCISPLLIVLYFNFALFNKKYSEFKPTLSLVDFRLSKDLFGLGFKFFIIQIAAIVQFQTANYIIIQNFGAEQVTNYNIAYKYFGILIMSMGIITAPLWSSVTDAYTRKDYDWVLIISKKYLKAGFLLALVGIFMLIGSDKIYNLWIGKGEIQISFSLSFWMFLYAIVNIFGSIYVGILNGIGALKIQFTASLFSPILFIMLVVVLIRGLNWGISSVVIAAVLANFNAFILAPMQFYKIFKQQKQKIWIA